MMTLVAAAMLMQIELPLNLPKLKSLAEEVRAGQITGIRQQLLDAAARAVAQGDPASAAYAQGGLALLYEATTRWAQSDSAWRAARETMGDREPGFAGRIAWWIAQEAAANGRLPRARLWCELAIGEARAAGDDRTLAPALQVAAGQMTGKARYEFLAEAMAAARRGGDARELARIQVDWGEARRAVGELGGALVELEAAAGTLKKIGTEREAGKAITTLARAYSAHGRFRDALGQLEAAETLLTRAGDPILLARTRVEMANLVATLGDRARALALLRRAEASMPAGERPLRTLLAHGYLGAREYGRAAEIAEPLTQGMLRWRPTAAHWILSAAWFHLGRYAEAIAVADAALAAADQPEALMRISAYRWRGRALDRLGRHAEAARDMREVARLGEAVLLKAAAEDEMRLAFTDRLEEIADDVIAVLWRAGQQREALEVAEHFRARAFLDLVASREGGGGEWLVPLARVVAHAGSTRSFVLAYWAHPERLYLWLITPAGEIEARQVEVSESRLSVLVAQARRLDYRPDRAAWRELYRLLIAPAGTALPRESELTVLPHGPLLQLPFAALLSPAGRYLVEDVRLRVTPAMALLVRGHAEGAAGPSVLAGAPVRSGLAALPGAVRELASIRGIVGGEQRWLSGAELSARAIEAAAPAARLLHFATHAVIDEREPMASYLAMSGGERLTAEAVYRWRLRADLVMLSACRGASGRVAADGLLGFPRAFLYAGAASVIAPLVDIPDETTARLVEEFYRQYARGRPKSEALRAAQVRLLTELRAGRVQVTTPAGQMALPEHPGLWAGFVLMGED